MTSERKARFGVTADLDNTIVDSELLCYEILAEEVKAVFRVGLDYREYLENRGKGGYWRILYQSLRGTEEGFQKFENRVNCGILDSITAGKLRLMPGARKLIEDLRTEGVLVAIATSGNRQPTQAKLRAVNLDYAIHPHFVLTADDHPRGLGKPDPYIFVEARRRMRVSPSRAAAIGDSRNDIIAARRAGYKLVVYASASPYGTGFEHRPDLEVGIVKEISARGIMAILEQRTRRVA